MENKEEFIFSITLGYKEYKSHFNGINIKIKNALKNGYSFSQIAKLTVENLSRLSNRIICYYLKFPIPMCQRQFFRIFSPCRGYVKIHCVQLKIPFRFACGKFLFSRNCTS